MRPISIRTGVLPRAHGSALFTRGETQALVVTTLGTKQDEQRLTPWLANTPTLHAALQLPAPSTGETGASAAPSAAKSATAAWPSAPGGRAAAG